MSPVAATTTPARISIDPNIPSLWDLASPEVLAQVSYYIPPYFVEAVCFWNAEYDRAKFMKYIVKAPPKLINSDQCEHLWKEYESFWPEVFGGCDWRDRDILDINSFDIVELPIGEPIAECVLIVNRYLKYKAECAAYNRMYFLSPVGDSQE